MANPLASRPIRYSYGPPLVNQLPSSTDDPRSLFLAKMILPRKPLFSTLPTLYNLSTLTGSCYVADKPNESVKGFVQSELGLLAHEVVACSEMQQSSESPDPQHISKCPDACDVSNCATVIINGRVNHVTHLTLTQIRIQSNTKDTDSTLRKLVIGLVYQLTSFRLWDDSISTVTGFYFPNIKEECVIQVDVTWRDETLSFLVYQTSLELEDVVPKLKAARDTALQQVQQRNPGQDLSRRCIPLTRAFVENHFPIDTFQMDTRESIILISPQSRKVWKYQMNDRYRSRLSLLKMKGATFLHSLLPEGFKEVGSHDYFEYKLLNYPLSKQDAKSRLPHFIAGVVEAIKELHQQGIAHMDIKLNNVCIGTNNEPVLIDLDRSMSVEDEVDFELGKASEMYIQPHADWRAENCDWRQLGIMIANILGNQDTKFYHKKIPDYGGNFLTTLIDEGQFNQDYFSCWLAELKSSN